MSTSSPIPRGASACVRGGGTLVIRGILRGGKFLSQQHQTRHTGVRGQVYYRGVWKADIGCTCILHVQGTCTKFALLFILQGCRTNPWTYTAETSWDSCRIGWARAILVTGAERHKQHVPEGENQYKLGILGSL